MLNCKTARWKLIQVLQLANWIKPFHSVWLYALSFPDISLPIFGTASSDQAGLPIHFPSCSYLEGFLHLYEKITIEIIEQQLSGREDASISFTSTI